MRPSLLANLQAQPDQARARHSYQRLAATYDGTCARIEALRLRAVRELALRPGETVFDIACGTGPTLPILAAAVAPHGHVLGVEMSPEMACRARQRIVAAGMQSVVQVIESPVQELQTDRQADAMLLSYTHDVLQSQPALARLLACARPGARIAILGLRTVPWLWGWPVNLVNLYRARHYLTTYRNLGRPWQGLADRGASLRVVHSALCGTAYIAVGHLPWHAGPHPQKSMHAV